MREQSINATRGAGKEETSCALACPERACQMFTAEQYRAKAAEFRAFLSIVPRSPNEMNEFRDLELIYTTLAENEEWMAGHIDKTIERGKNCDSRTALAEEEEQILQRLGVEYRPDQAPTGALRLRRRHRRSAADNPAAGTDRPLPSQS